MPQTAPALLTTMDAAREAGVSPETIRAWEKLGKLRAIRTLSGQRLFTSDALREAIAARELRRHVG